MKRGKPVETDVNDSGIDTNPYEWRGKPYDGSEGIESEDELVNA